MFMLETSLSPTPTGWLKLSVDEMAATMQHMDAAGVSTTPENLQLRGYSKDDISRYGLPAARLARMRSAICGAL